MINDTPRENPLRRWRLDHGFKVSEIVRGSEFSGSAWFAWEAYPIGARARIPGPKGWTFIREVTLDAVTPNDFHNMLQGVAA